MINIINEISSHPIPMIVMFLSFIFGVAASVILMTLSLAPCPPEIDPEHKDSAESAQGIPYDTIV